MSHFERTEGFKDNLGQNPEFIHLEELAVDTAPTPDQILMGKEEREDFGIDEAKETPDEDYDSEPSNWEVDVDSGKYDEYRNETTPQPVTINPIHQETRRSFSQIKEMKGRERFEKYWAADKPSEAKNSKPQRPQDERDSIRFDEAV